MNDSMVQENDIESEDEFMWPTTSEPEIDEPGGIASLDLLRLKSRTQYEKTYNHFMNWCEQKNAVSYTEDILLAYLEEKSKDCKPSSLSPTYSMLRATLIVKNNVDISKYSRVLAFLKETSKGFKPNKTVTFSRDQIYTFLSVAPDEIYLLAKVCAILGIAGTCRCEDLVNLTIDDIQDLGSALIVKILDSKTNAQRCFTVFNIQVNETSLLDIYRKYAVLRPPHTNHRRFFVFFSNGRQECSTQVVGRNRIGKIPSQIAKFLQLPNPSSYTGHCFRRCSTTFFTDAGADNARAKRRRRQKWGVVDEGFTHCSNDLNRLNWASSLHQDISQNTSTNGDDYRNGHLYTKQLEIDKNNVKIENIDVYKEDDDTSQDKPYSNPKDTELNTHCLNKNSSNCPPLESVDIKEEMPERVGNSAETIPLHQQEALNNKRISANTTTCDTSVPNPNRKKTTKENTTSDIAVKCAVSDSELENEFDVFCKSLAIQLKKMPLHRALICQEKLQSVIIQERLSHLNQS